MSNGLAASVGVTQGCVLSPTLFDVLLEYVMTNLITANLQGRFNPSMYAGICFDDDITLLSSNFNTCSSGKALLHLW